MKGARGDDATEDEGHVALDGRSFKNELDKFLLYSLLHH